MSRPFKEGAVSDHARSTIHRAADFTRRALLTRLLFGAGSITPALVVVPALPLAQEPQAPEGEKPPQQDPSRGRGEGRRARTRRRVRA
jgi:hypothetical protein